MSAKPIRELIGDAAADCPSVLIRGDVYELGAFVEAALAKAGFKVLAREPTREMVLAHPLAHRTAWCEMFDAATPPTTTGSET